MRSAKFSKIVIFTVCILLVFAVAAALLFDGASLPASGNVIADIGEGADEVAEASYPVSADGYTHGSNIGRATSGTAINSASGLVSLLSGSGSGYLTTDITLSESDSFTSTRTFTGTLYGNGHTVTVTGNQTAWQSVSDGSEIGGLVTKLSGSIYDLNVVLKSGTSAMYKSSDRQIKLGLIAGVIDNGTIENCTVTINSGSMLGAVSANAASYSNGANCGAVAGQCNSSMTIKNVTVTNNGSIVGAVVAGNGYREGSGGASMFVGLIWNDNSSYVQKMDNLVTVGNGNVHGWASSMLGYLYTASTAYPITVTNYYNQFTGNYRYGSVSGGIFGSGTVQMVSYTLLKWKGSSDSSKVVNYYHSSGTDQSKMSSGFYAVPDNSITVAATEYKVGFDPKQTDTANSLVVYKSGVTGGENYSAAITTNSGTKYSDKYAFSDDGGTVIFRQLPTAISNWGGNNGTFACTINITQDAIQVDKLDPVNKWESSYTTTKSTTGTAVDDGSKLTTAINNNQNIYLTSDITDFKGFTHTGEYTGTLDGNGHTIYIVNGAANSADTVGGLFKRLSGTIKNVRIVLYSSYNRTISAGSIGTGIIAGNLCGGTVDNVYVYVPSDVTFGANGGSNYESYVGAVAGLSDAGYTIKNTTVDIDGEIRLDGSWIYLSAFIGKSQSSTTQYNYNFTNVTFRGNGSFNNDYCKDSEEPIFLGGATVLFTSGSSGNAKLNIDGFINDFQGSVAAQNYSMYGILTQNQKTGTLAGWTINTANVYDYDTPLADINKTTTGNKYIEITSRSTVSTTAEGSSIKVTPYFPAGDTTNLVLVAGDGSQSVPDLAYGDYKSTTDGNYKVVTVPKSAISAGSTVTLAEPVTPATPIADMNKWENGYVESSDVVPDGYTAVSDGAELANAIAANANIFLTADIMDYVGFNSASETDGGYSGIFDGNGHTVYIVKANTVSKQYVGGLFGKLKGTVKDVRIVVMAGVDLPSTTYVGAVAGALSGNANVSNVNVIINSGVNLVISGSSSNVGGAGGIAGGLTSGSGETVTISNSTVALNGTLKATAQYTFIAGFVGHLNGGSVNYTDLTFKGNGMLDGVANAGEGVHTAGAGVVGGGVSAVNVNGFINSFNGSLSNGRSAYEVVVRNSQSTSISVNVSNVYTYGTVTTYDGSMDYGKPVACDKSTIATTVADTQIPVTPYFPVTNSGELVLVAGDGTSECPFVTYESYEGAKDGNYMVVSIPKTEIAAQSNVQLIQGKSPVNEPSLATTEENLVYNGGEITVAINQLMSGTTAIGEGDYTLTVTAKDGGTGSVQNNKPVNAGDYTLTVTLLNDYEFADGTTKKTLEFTVTPFEISGTLSISTSAVYDKTEKTVIFTADDGKGLFGGDNVVISYNGGDRINVTEAGFTATATVPNANYTFVNSASSIEKTFKITAKELTVVWGETSFTYDGGEKVPTAEVTEGIIEGDSVTLSVSGAETNAGSGYTATATISPANANYALANGTIQFSIAKAKVSVSGNNATAEYKAAKYTEAEIKAAVFTNGLPDDATTNIAVSPESVINADDSATVTVTLKDGNNYEFEAGATTQFTFTVVAKEISLPEASADKTAVYSPSTSYTAAQITELIFGTASVENVTVKVMNGDVEISGDTPVSGAGVYTVTATANENYVFVADTVTQYTFEITKAPITLGVSVADWIYGNQASAPVITGNDGSGAVTYLYKGDGYSDSAVPTKAGTYSLEITVAETVNYQGGKASCEFTIEKAVVTVPTIEDKAYTGEILKADIADTDEYEVVENNGGRDVATYDVVIRLKDAANYKWSDGTETAEITLEFNIVASGNSWINEPEITGWTYGQYSAETNAPVYKAKEGNETAVVEFKLQSEADSEYRPVADLSKLDAGAYNMRVSVPKTEDYGGLSMVVEFAVSKAQISVTVEISGWAYGDEANAPSVDGNTAGGKVTYSYVGTGNTAYEESETAPVNAGTYKVKATVAETTNYLGATAEAEFTIAKKAITATVSAEKATYDGIKHAATVSFDGKLTDDELTANLLYNGEAEAPVNAGSYTVTVGSYDGAAVGNYEITTAEGEVVLKISPKELTIDDIVYAPVDESEDGIYDGEAHAITASVNSGSLCGEDIVTLRVLYNGYESAPVNAGTYTVTFEITDNANYAIAEDTGFELTVAKAKVSVSGANATAVYTGEAFEDNEIIKAVFGDADLSLVEVNISYGESAAAQYAGDKATLTLTLKDGNNYEFAAETVTTYTFTVTAGTVSLSGENATVEYRGTAYTEKEIKNAVFGEGTWEKFVITISYNNTEALNAGDIATVTVTGYSDPNYSLDPEMTKEYTFTVETFKVAAPQLTADSFVYNGEAQTVSLTDDTYVDISANVQTDKGDYNAVAALKDKANYEWTAGGKADIELPWSITAKDITLKAETSVDKTYDGDAYDFSRYVVSGADGFYARDNVIVTVSAGTTYTPGSYGITVSHDANGNYNVTVEPTDAKLTINKAVLTVTAKDAEIEYTGNIITFEFDITAGRVGDDDVQIDGVTYKQNGVAVAPQETGTYDVTFTLKGAQAAYYTANATQVKVTPQTATAPDGMTSESIVLPADDDMIYDGEAHVAILNYTATDGNKYGIIYHNGTSYVDEAVNAGEYTVHVYKNTKTNIVVGISKTMTVEKKILLSDDIKFTSGGKLSFTYSGAENVVTAIATGVKGEDVALTTLYDGGDKAPVDAGEYTVTFASANGNYAVDESVSYKMSVAKANVDAPKANELVYNGSEQIAFSENSLYTAGGVIAATDVSEEGYTATFTLTSDNYKWSNKGDEVREISVIWNIAPATVTITVSDAQKEKVYDGAALTQEELAALFVAPDKIGDGKVEIVVAVKDGGEVLNVGVYTVTAKLNDINYVADKAETTFTVTQATPKVTVKVQDKLLQEGDKLSTVGIYLEEGSTPGAVSWADTELALAKGENVVTWTYVPEDTLNYTGATGSLTLTVGDEVLTAFEMKKGPDKTEYTAFEAFDPTGIELMATFDGVHEQPVAIDECEIVVENAAADGKLTAATTKVTVKYGNMSVEIAVSVAKIKVEIPALEQTEFEYTAQPHTVAVAEDPRYTIVKGNEETNVGKYNAVVSLTDKVNYEWADGLAEDRMLSWEITPVTLSGYITLPENLVYDGVAKVAAFTLTKGELLGGATMNIAYELTDGTVLQGAPVDAGVYEVVATLPDTKNYRFEEGTEYCKAMTVEKKTVTIITIGSREKVYDGSEVTSEQLAEHFSATDGITVKVTASGTVLNAGTYQITATIEEKNYRAEPVSCTYTVRKASQTAKADISVGYLKVEITAADETAIVEYSEDGNVWKTLDGAITVGLKATYSYYVRYAESANYNASAAVKVEGNITKAALMQYVEERFTGDITLADAADVAKLEELAKSAEGQNADFDKALESLSAQREELVNGATSAVEKALKAGGALKGYAAVATALAITVGGISAAAAVGLIIGKGKGGKKNEEK